MEISFRALVTEIHGMLFGVFFLLAIFGIVVELYRSAWVQQPSPLTAPGYLRERLYLVVTAGLGWAAVLSGAYIIYPWYRAVPPAGLTTLGQYPRYLLLSSNMTAGWHNVGMEWKEYIAWCAVIAITMAAYVLIHYGHSFHQHPQVRKAVLVFVVVALFSAGIAGYFGAMLNKQAPVDGGGTAIHWVGGSK